MDTNPLLALATAAALPQLAFDPKNIGCDASLFYGITGPDSDTGIRVQVSDVFAQTDDTAMQAARAAFVAAACNAVMPLVQERELLLEAGKKAMIAMTAVGNVLGWEGASLKYLDAMNELRAAIAEAEAGGDSHSDYHQIDGKEVVETVVGFVSRETWDAHARAMAEDCNQNEPEAGGE
jgi:hypothetical protein